MSILDISFGLSSSSMDDVFAQRDDHGLMRRRIASVDSIPGFMRVANDTLIHIAQQDFWKIAYDADGNPFIERLVDDEVKG